MTHLKERWAEAIAGNGGGVFISGEAGIGKSRLARELEHHVHADAALVLKYHGSPQHSNSDLHPVIEHLYLVAGVRRTEPDAVRYAKIEKMLALSSPSYLPARMLQGLVALGGVPTLHDEQQSPRLRRDAVLGALIEGVADMSQIKPLLMIVDDAQWFDPTSVELLNRLVERSQNLRILLVVTARREFHPDWISLKQISLLLPRRLNAEDTKTLAARVAGANSLSPAAFQNVVDRSEGVPLFVEELTRELAAMGPGPNASLAVPASLQTLLLSRLDRLGPAKRMAQNVSALGRRFSHDLGAAVWDGSEREFQLLIERLMAAEILLPMPVAPGAFYAFRHALLQEAAYASFEPKQRQLIHAKIVDTLERHAQFLVVDQPEIMAFHCNIADQHAMAAAHWLEAGKASAARGSVLEAVNFFELGLTSADRAADAKSCEQLKFELFLNLGPALMALKGYSSDAGLEAFEQARQRLNLSRSSMEQIHVLLGLFNFHFGRGELNKALEVAQQADQALAVGYGGYPVLLGQSLCTMGRFPEARRSLEKALAGYDASLDAQSGLFCRADVVATSFLAKTEFALGNLDRAAELTQAAMDLARQQGHPVALAIAYLSQLFFASEAGDLALAQTTAEEALAHATKHDLGNYLLWVSFHCAALTLRADAAASIAIMEKNLEQAKSAGTLMFRPAQLGLLGAAYSSQGKHEDALHLIDEGIATAQQTGGLESLPALYRLRANTLTKLMRPAAAIREAEHSLSIAQAQSARTEELRAATLLARLLSEPVRREQVLDLLSNLYAKFQHGLQIPDLKHAARVLTSFGRRL